jgi:hypothetical protein
MSSENRNIYIYVYVVIYVFLIKLLTNPPEDRRIPEMSDKVPPAETSSEHPRQSDTVFELKVH